MADEPEGGAEEQGQQSSGILGKLIALGIVVVGSAVAGVLAYVFVLAPLFAEPPPAADPTENPGDAIPPGAVAFDFPEKMVSVQGDAAGGASPVLQYRVSVVCANEQTRQLVEANSQWFEAKFDEMHRGKTKADLNNPQALKNITRQAQQEANSLLRRLQEAPDPEVQIIEVLHIKFAVLDL